MNNVFASLPWLIASAAALIVGGVSLFSAGGLADPWVSLGRAGIAFVAFGLIGALIRAVLNSQVASAHKDGRPNKATVKDTSHSAGPDGIEKARSGKPSEE